MIKALTTFGLGLAAALAWCGPANAQVELSKLDKDMAGPRAQVLVLGSVHLAQRPEGLDAAALEPLIERLVAFRPDIVTAENISGASCELMARYESVYGPPADNPYCGSPAVAAEATGLDVPTAIGRIHEILSQWPRHPAPAQRRELAALLLAANDRASALVQWLQLPDAERRAGDGLDDTLVAMLRKDAGARDETTRIAVQVAVRLGLPRVHPVDDHTGDHLDVPEAEIPAFADALRTAWGRGAARTQPLQAREDALYRDGEILALYRRINRPDVRQVRAEVDFAGALADPSPQHYGQRYVAGWETRNLRMVANVRATFRDRPGARVLAIVGAQHKPWFDSLLGQMQGVDIVDAGKVLE